MLKLLTSVFLLSLTGPFAFAVDSGCDIAVAFSDETRDDSDAGSSRLALVADLTAKGYRVAAAGAIRQEKTLIVSWSSVTTSDEHVDVNNISASITGYCSRTPDVIFIQSNTQETLSYLESPAAYAQQLLLHLVTKVPTCDVAMRICAQH